MRGSFSLGASGAVIATVAALSLAAASASADNELGPDEVLSGIVADDGSSPCADATCQSAFDLPNSTLQIKTTAEDVASNGTSATISADFSVDAESDDPEDETKLVGSQVSMMVEAHGLLSALGADAAASYRIDVRVTDLDDGVVVGAQQVASDDEEDAEQGANVAELVVLPVMMVRGHDYRVALMVTVAAEAGSGESASADFLMDGGFARWVDLTVIAGSDPFGPLRDLTERVDALENEVGDLRDDFENHTHEYLTGRGTGHNNTVAVTSTPDGAEEAVQEPPVQEVTPEPVNPGGQSNSNWGGSSGSSWWKNTWNGGN